MSFYCSKCKDKNYLVQCACICGNIRCLRDRRGRIKLYIQHHGARIGGIWIDDQGYVMICISGKVYRYHRWVYEQVNKCCLLKWIDIHHRDNNPRNNFPNNLQPILSRSKHNQLRKGVKRIPIDRRCIICHGLAIQNWYRYNSGYQCTYCYRKERAGKR